MSYERVHAPGAGPSSRPRGECLTAAAVNTPCYPAEPAPSYRPASRPVRPTPFLLLQPLRFGRDPPVAVRRDAARSFMRGGGGGRHARRLRLLYSICTTTTTPRTRWGRAGGGYSLDAAISQSSYGAAAADWDEFSSATRSPSAYPGNPGREGCAAPGLAADFRLHRPAHAPRLVVPRHRAGMVYALRGPSSRVDRRALRERTSRCRDLLGWSGDALREAKICLFVRPTTAEEPRLACDRQPERRQVV